jgi:hypothetical protein
MRSLRKSVFIVQSIVLVFGLRCSSPTKDESRNDNSVVANSFPIILDNARAAVTGAGYANNTQIATSYDTTSEYVINLGTGSKVTYTAGNNVGGSYDVYLEVSRAPMGFGTTPFSISINSGQEIVPIIEYGFCKADKSNLYNKGVFLSLNNNVLNAGDTITIKALPGFVSGTSSFLPFVGDLRLYPPGEKVAVGYDGAIPSERPKNPADSLSGLRLIWLGSSVTYGQMAQGYSMADYLEESHQALKSCKYTVSGTTLVEDTATSYISRMKRIPTGINPDFFIVQLSTNDAVLNKTLGTLSSSTNMRDFDTQTIYGATEYVIAYASETWNCPVVFFTGTYFDGRAYGNDTIAAAYGNMVEALLKVRQKWNIDVIDLYNDADMRAIYNTDQYWQYMSDGVHPKVDGYNLWWGPKFEQGLRAFITTPSTALIKGEDPFKWAMYHRLVRR